MYFHLLSSFILFVVVVVVGGGIVVVLFGLYSFAFSAECKKNTHTYKTMREKFHFE